MPLEREMSTYGLNSPHNCQSVYYNTKSPQISTYIFSHSVLDPVISFSDLTWRSRYNMHMYMLSSACGTVKVLISGSVFIGLNYTEGVLSSGPYLVTGFNGCVCVCVRAPVCVIVCVVRPTTRTFSLSPPPEHGHGKRVRHWGAITVLYSNTYRQGEFL